MTIPFVDLKSQYTSIKRQIDTAIDDVINETSFIGGPHVKTFESEFAKVYGVKHCIGVANGTDALYITMKMLGIGPGDEVITSASSWISTSETITQTGARPVFVDIHPDTYTIDPDLIAKKINARTKAVIPVHLYGQAAHIQSIKELCDEQGLFLIEDCAQSHLTEEKGKLVGTWGTAGTLSFYPGKNLGAYGDAGAVITNDDTLAEKIRMYANHGALKKHEHKIEGVNSRLDAIQAAILSAKLPYLKKWTDQRIANANIYSNKLKESNLVLPRVRPLTKHSFHLYVIRSRKRDQLKAYVESKGVQTAIHYPTALPNLPSYKYLNHQEADFPVASNYQREILSLPMYPELTEEQIDYVCARILEFIQD
ncbi:MAG: DegT/DnrJ/EryC1/StrS family aminotransferase [Cyclobacteriaceae bacterium]